MQGKEIGKLAYNASSFQAYLCFVVVLLGGLAIFFLRAADDRAAQEIVTLPYVVTGCVVVIAVLTYRTLRTHVLRVRIDEELTVKTLFGTEVFSFHEVAGMQTGVLTSQADGVLAPLRKVKSLGVLLVVTLHSGREMLCTIAPSDIELIAGFLEQRKELDLDSAECLSTPRALVKELSDSVMEGTLGDAQRFFVQRLGVENGQNALVAAEYAITLKQIIDDNWFLEFDQVSDEAEEASPYYLVQDSSSEMSESAKEAMMKVVLQKNDGAGVWRFGHETTELIRQWLQCSDDDNAEI